ncbi:piggyBac transposable element-derived protein 4-like [Saccostrea cucullata]|uniref:piggyBac transposable element-derived protein 4-like n=1 Tax=Saccostrea cuccullata TaxID=36930 RepID=UPI002ED3C879
MAERVNIIEELLADSESEGEENFEGFNLEDLEDSKCVDESNYDVLNDELWSDGDRVPFPLNFEQVPGLQNEISNTDSPLEFFELFVDDNDYENISQETNKYANQFLNSGMPLKEKSRFHKWIDTTGLEFKKFLALIIAMGLVCQIDVSEYWTVNPVTSTPFFPSVMSRDRFLLILAFLHLNDDANYIPRGSEGFNPLFKLGSFYNKFLLYTGRSNIQPSKNGATYDLVMDLLRNHFEKGHILYCDNYYSSPQLFMDLWVLGTGATGTVRPYRKGIPEKMKKIQLTNRGDTATAHYGPLSCLKYQDSKTVYLISTTESSTNVETGHHCFIQNQIKVRPSMVQTYDKKMGAVDRHNQMIENYKLPIKTLKWWKKLFFHIMNVAIVNSYILYKESCKAATPMLQRNFRRKLVEQLIQTSGATIGVHVGRPAPRILERLTGRHFLARLEEGGKMLLRQCIVCGPAEKEMLPSMRPGEKRPSRCGHTTSYKCKECNVALCLTPCFEIYHTKLEYVLAYKRMKLSSED